MGRQRETRRDACGDLFFVRVVVAAAALTVRGTACRSASIVNFAISDALTDLGSIRATRILSVCLRSLRGTRSGLRRAGRVVDLLAMSPRWADAPPAACHSTSTEADTVRQRPGQPTEVASSRRRGAGAREPFTRSPARTKASLPPTFSLDTTSPAENRPWYRRTFAP